MASSKPRSALTTSPKISTAANPTTKAPPAPPVERIDESILTLPEPNSDTIQQSAADVSGVKDEPGPSSTFIPRQPSPPLPDLRSKRFPPDYSSDEEDDSDDEVVATLPIYISANMHPHLHLFQYPLQTRSLVAPSWARDRGKDITTRIKERASRVEVEIPVDAGTSVWRDSRARDLGMTHDMGNGDVEGGYGFGGRGDDDYANSRKKGKGKDARWGDKIRLRSEELPSTTGYYAGIVHEGALHLHPLSRILQMRTSLQYLDDFEQQQKRSRRRMNGDDDEPEGGDKKPAVPGSNPAVRPLRKYEEEEGDGSGSIKDFRNKMWRTAQDEAEDTWIPYAWRTGDVSFNTPGYMISLILKRASRPLTQLPWAINLAPILVVMKRSFELTVQDEQVIEALQRMVVPEDKREKLACTTRGLDYLDKAVDKDPDHAKK